MALCAYNGQASCGLGLWTKLNIGSSTCHIGGNGYYAWPSCLGYNLCLPLMQFRIQDIVMNLPQLQASAQQFRNLYIGCSHQNRSPRFGKLYNLFNYGIVLFSLGFVNQIFAIVSLYRTIGWNSTTSNL